MISTPPLDSSRAQLLDKASFDRFEVRVMEPLQEALHASSLRPDQLLLVLVRSGQALALDAAQMSYHHVAQGELAGEPWLVTF